MNELGVTDTIEGVVRTADGRRKIELGIKDFPLTCHEGDVIELKTVVKESEQRHYMFLIRRDEMG